VPLTRSQQMARIGGQDTEPELLLRAALRSQGLRYRLRERIGRTRPDMTFPRQRVAVFVDGCFWHGCPKHYVNPRSGGAFWPRKLATNVARDQRLTQALEDCGWRTLRFWEHEVFEQPTSVAKRWRPVLRWHAAEVMALPSEGDMENWRLVELRGLAPDRLITKKRSTRKWRRT
jgi:DNA mismatch endonuclease, patch repair protein